MAAFFIDRPVFAWVVAILICLGGLIAIPLLAVAQYPIIAPPSISISTSYPGASPENLYNSVTRLIVQELNARTAFSISNRPATRLDKSKSQLISFLAPTPTLLQ